MTNGHNQDDVNIANHIREMVKLFHDEYTGDFEHDMIINYRIMMISFNIEYMKKTMRHNKKHLKQDEGL